MQSLHGFCKQYRLSKTSVRRWLLDRGFDTSKGMTQDAVEAALAEFVTQPSSSSPVTVLSGNHRVNLSTPVIEGSFDLGQFRDAESVSFSDPLAVAEQFLATAELIEYEMQADIERQRQKLSDTEVARKKISAKAQELMVKRHIYNDRSNDLAARQNSETQDLQQALSELQRLGKPNV